MIQRRSLLTAVLAAPAIIASRRSWAGGAITLIVPAAAGSSTDQVARAFAPFLERHLPRSVVWIANRPGDGGLTGLRRIADADPDGHTIGWVATPTMTALSVDHPGTVGLIGELRLIGAVAAEPIAFVRNAGSAGPGESGTGDGGTGEVTIATISAHRGEGVAAFPFATPPAGSPAHLAALSFVRLTQAALDIIPFPSAAAARQAALSGNVAAASLGLADSIDMIRAGQLSALALSARSRFDEIADAPLLRESNIDLTAQVYRGVAAPSAVPDELAAKYAAALSDVATDPEFEQEGSASGFTALWISGQDWSAQAVDDRKRLAGIWRENPWLPAHSG